MDTHGIRMGVMALLEPFTSQCYIKNVVMSHYL